METELTPNDLIVTLRKYQMIMDQTNALQWEALADLYEHYGLMSNADACRRRAAYYRGLSGGEHEENR